MNIDFTNNVGFGICSKFVSPVSNEFKFLRRAYRRIFIINQRFNINGVRSSSKQFGLSGVFIYCLSHKIIDDEDCYYNYRFEVWLKGVVVCEKDSKFYRV